MPHQHQIVWRLRSDETTNDCAFHAFHSRHLSSLTLTDTAVLFLQVSGPSSQPFTTAISVDKSGVRKSKGEAFDTAAPSATESAPSSSTEGTQISSSNSCASFADDRSGSYNGSTTGGGSSSSSGYSSNDNRSSDGVSDQGDSN